MNPIIKIFQANTQTNRNINISFKKSLFLALFRKAVSFSRKQCGRLAHCECCIHRRDSDNLCNEVARRDSCHAVTSH